MEDLKRLWKAQPVVLSAVLAALALALFFAIRVAVLTLHMQFGAPQGPAPQGWMTPGYLGHAWAVDPHEMLEELDVDFPNGKPMTLYQIAARKGIPQQDFLEAVSAWLEEATGHD